MVYVYYGLHLLLYHLVSLIGFPLIVELSVCKYSMSKEGGRTGISLKTNGCSDGCSWCDYPRNVQIFKSSFVNFLDNDTKRVLETSEHSLVFSEYLMSRKLQKL